MPSVIATTSFVHCSERRVGLLDCLQSKTCLIYFLLIFSGGVTLFTQGGCRTPSGTPICCRGKQSTCCGYTYDDSGNRTYSYPYLCPTSEIISFKRKFVKTCFCDEFCTSTNDCCPDYRTVCDKPVIDCTVSEWGPWGECSRQCGQGVSIRRRRITQLPRSGGQHCPVLEESKPCQGYSCASRRVGRSGNWMLLPFMRQARTEVAHLLPSPGDVLGITRRWDMRWDERRKLYLGKLIKQNKTEQPEPDPYCAVYELTYANRACRPDSLNDYNYYQTAPSSTMYGRNAYLSNSYAYRTRVPRRARRRHAFNSLDVDTVILGPEVQFRNPWIDHGELIAKGSQICITCYPTYMREDLGFRCSGTGMLNVETRWRAVRTTDCHGRFRMVTMPQRGCTCAATATSFIFI